MDKVKKSGDHVIGRSQNELDPALHKACNTKWLKFKAKKKNVFRQFCYFFGHRDKKKKIIHYFLFIAILFYLIFGGNFRPIPNYQNRRKSKQRKIFEKNLQNGKMRQVQP